MAEPIIPAASVFETAAINAIVALRPESLKHFNEGGRWADLPALWRPQALLLQARLADEVAQKRLSQASGQGLRALASSEFDCRLPVQPQSSLGTAALSRTGVVVRGTTASMTYLGGGVTRIDGLTGMTQTNVGLPIQTGNTSVKVNNGALTVLSVLSPTSVTVNVTKAGSDGAILVGGGVASLIDLVTSDVDFSLDTVGEVADISGSGIPANNGSFPVTGAISATAVVIDNPSAATDSPVTWIVHPPNGADPNSGKITWSAPTFPAGVIKVGTIFTKRANPAAVPLPVTSAQYTVAQTVYIPAGATTTSVLLEASAPGSGSNVPSFDNYATQAPLIAPAAPLFDPTFVVTSAFQSGGSDGLPDPVLVAAAKAFALGTHGPNEAALVAGLLSQQSVRHVAAFPAGALPYGQAFIADQSWACADAWVSQVQQAFNSQWLGFGCAVRFGTVTNRQIALVAAIALVSTDDLADTADIDLIVRAAAESYFNDRPDWYLWRYGGLQAALTACDPRIQQCTSVTVSDPVTGLALAEPPNNFGESWQGSIEHPYLTDSNCQTTYGPPI